ncbi:MAG: phosphatidate cytidylyltransferase [Thermoleophilaceae bacterium]
MGGGETGSRVLAALPAIAFAVFIVARGGIVFTLGLILLGVLALTELYRMMHQARPVNLAGFLALAGMCVAAQYGGQYQVLLVLVASVLVTYFLAVLRPWRENASWGIAATIFGVVWIGLPFAHAVLLRGLDHGGGLVVDTLIGTFIGDTAAYFGGRAWGQRQIAPRISPNKTLEGLISGFVGGTFAFWLFAKAYQHDWFHGTDALIIGACVAAVAPIGDLFESLVKRDLGVKDSGRFFGAHGGVLDRLDAIFFSIVVAYYVSRAVL